MQIFLQCRWIEYFEDISLFVSGIILTNTAACNSVAGGEDSCIGLFPVFSLLTHGCVANTRRETEAGKMTVIGTPSYFYHTPTLKFKNVDY